MIEIQIPVGNEDEVLLLEEQMRKAGGRDVDIFAGLLNTAKVHFDGQMSRFRHPVTGDRVPYSFRRERRMLVLEVELEDEHEDVIAEYLGDSSKEG